MDRSLSDGSTVIDTDIHLQPNKGLRDEIAERLDEPHRTHVHPDIETGSPYQSSGRNSSLSGKIQRFRSSLRRPEDITRPLCDERSTDHMILNNFHRVYSILDYDRAIQEMQAVNDIMIERFLDHEDRFSGLLSIAHQQPEKAAEEIDRLGDEDQIVGIFLVNVSVDKPLGDPRYDVIYEAAEDHDLAVVYHATAAHLSQGEFPVLAWNFEKRISETALTFPWANMKTMTSLLIQGTPVKFPDLDFTFLEAGLGVYPYMMARLNKKYKERRIDAPLLEKTPEEYIRERFYFGTQPLGEFNNPTHIKQIMEIVGPENILYASDYPHHDTDELTALNKLFQQFDPEDREKMLYKNAAKVFNIDV